VRIDETEDVEIVRQLLRAHEYWRMKQLSADLVVIMKGLHRMLRVADLSGWTCAWQRLRLSPDTDNVRGSIFLLRADSSPPRERTVLQTVCTSGAAQSAGTLSEQITRSQRTEAVASPILRVSRAAKRLDVPLPQQALESFNGLGGFADKGREFVTVLG